MKAYVLAAGYATRLHPLTIDRPKPLLEVGGLPILTHVARRLATIDAVEEIVVVTNSRFVANVREWAAENPVDRTITVLDDGTNDEPSRLGAVGDLAFAIESVPTGDAPFIVTAGDAIYDFDIEPLYREFVEREANLLVVRDCPHDGGPTPYNEVEIDGERRVIRFREKPEDARSGLAAIALYFFVPEVAEHLRRYLAEGGNPDAPGHFVAWLVDEAPAVAARLDGSWLDIGTHETLAEARRLFGDRQATETPDGKRGAWSIRGKT